MFIKDIDKEARASLAYIRRNREILGKMKADDFGYTLKQLMKWSGVGVRVLSERSLISTKTIQRMRNSLSVSDVVVVKNQAFYVDIFGFRPLPDFVKPELTENRTLDEVQKRQEAMDSRKDLPTEAPDKQKPPKKPKL